MYGAAAGVIRIFRVPRETMLAPLSIDDFGVGRRILSLLEELLDLIHGIVQIAVIHRATGNVDLPPKLWAEYCPIALDDVSQVVMILPVFGHIRIDLPGQLVVERFVVAVGSNRTKHRGPCIVLAARASVGRDG